MTTFDDATHFAHAREQSVDSRFVELSDTQDMLDGGMVLSGSKGSLLNYRRLAKQESLRHYCTRNCGYRIAVIISVFQTDDAGSTPATRSIGT